MISTYYIDIVGSCNLKCPSCPLGNSPGISRPGGVMGVELFEAIVKKIRRESPSVKVVHLYNWTEPTLNKNLPELIHIARKHKLRSRLSTNLTVAHNLERVMEAEPGAIVISLSGFSQSVYSQTHSGGDIELVKENMLRLRDYRNRQTRRTQISVSYHCYRHNLGEEYRQMADLCRQLDFIFVPTIAFLYPLEKVLDIYRGKSPEDLAKLVDLLLVSPARAREFSLQAPSRDCSLRSTMNTINCDGSVSLCCTAYDSDYIVADSFVDTPQEELQKRKNQHRACGECMRNGLHDTFLYTAYDKWLNEAVDNMPELAELEELFPRRN